VNKDHELLADLIATEMAQQLERQHVPYEASKQHYLSTTCRDFMPPGVSKHFTTQHAVELIEREGTQVKAVMTVDDNHNGRPMLVARTYTGIDGRPIDNYPIVMGDRMQDDDELNQHPRLIRVLENGKLGAALRRQRARIG
jgi:hypothetical protein